MAGQEGTIVAVYKGTTVLTQGVRIADNHTWPLRLAAEAHRAVEGAKTTGSVVLLPNDCAAAAVIWRRWQG